jgi:hypothetical protein
MRRLFPILGGGAMALMLVRAIEAFRDHETDVALLAICCLGWIALYLHASSLLDRLERLHASDCATHNEPAAPAGPCDCGEG